MENNCKGKATMEENRQSDLADMNSSQDDLLIEKFNLYSKLVEGLEDFQNGKHEPFGKAMLDIKKLVGLDCLQKKFLSNMI